MGQLKRVLIVEDDADSLAITSAALAYSGFAVFTVQDGAQACGAAVTHRPDLIILDVRLPNTSGDVIAAELHGDGRCAHIPIVVVTADIAALTMRFPPNVRGLLLKPCDPRILIDIALAAVL